MIRRSLKLILQRASLRASPTDPAWKWKNNSPHIIFYGIYGFFRRLKSSTSIFSQYEKVSASNRLHHAECVFYYEYSFHYWNFPDLPVSNHVFALESVSEKPYASSNLKLSLCLWKPVKSGCCRTSHYALAYSQNHLIFQGSSCSMIDLN